MKIALWIALTTATILVTRPTMFQEIIPAKNNSKSDEVLQAVKKIPLTIEKTAIAPAIISFRTVTNICMINLTIIRTTID